MGTDRKAIEIDAEIQKYLRGNRGFYLIYLGQSLQAGPCQSEELTSVSKAIQKFHCFTVHFNSLCVMVQLMHLFVIKH
jgi:hypothetical protein